MKLHTFKYNYLTRVVLRPVTKLSDGIIKYEILLWMCFV